MNLSAFRVGSDGFPSIKALIDFKNDPSFCECRYENPGYQDFSYTLTGLERERILALLSEYDVKALEKEYRVGMTDQPISTVIMYTNKDTLRFKDCGLIGQYPLNEIYKVVYKLNINIR